MAEADTTSARRPRIFIACQICRTRKIRCDGKTPRCTKCISDGTVCIYAAVRNTRGPAKKKKNTNVDGHPSNTASSQSKDSNCLTARPGPSPCRPDIQLLEVQQGLQQHDPKPPNGPISPRVLFSPEIDKARPPVVADFLRPGVYEEHLKTLKARIGESATGFRLTPLLPQHIATRLIQNTFADVMAGYHLLDLVDFVILLEVQYADGTSESSSSPARWAIVNAVLALALRVKMAPGSEADLSDIPLSYYRNATAVLPDLILQMPSLLSAQALLAMAMFAWGIPDSQAVIMLVSNASRLLELLRASLLESQAPDTEEVEQYKRAQNISQTLETRAILEKDT